MRGKILIIIIAGSFIIGGIVGGLVVKNIKGNLSERYEIVATNGRFPLIIKMDRLSGDSWYFKLGKWNKVTSEEKENSRKGDINKDMDTSRAVKLIR